MAERQTLVLEIDAPSLRAMLESGSRTVIAKHGSLHRGQVAWLAWQPSARDTIAWDETYGLYAAYPALGAGCVLSVVATLDRAQDRGVYPFRSNSFGAPVAAPELPPRHYDVRNDSAATMTFGLLQAATVNGRRLQSPLNAAAVAPEFAADFAPPTSVSLWSERGTESGSIVRIPPSAATITLNAARPIERWRYDRLAARFVRSTRGSDRLDFAPRPRPPPQRSSSAAPNSVNRLAKRMESEMSWSVYLDVEPAFQITQSFCAPACVQMILSTLGLRGLDPQVQHLLKTSVNTWNGPWPFGSPVGVACTTNRFNTGGTPSGPAVPPSKEFRVARTATPYESSSAIADSLHRHRAASVVMVFGSTHWIVVFGAEGPGVPGGASAYGIDNLWICNPADRQPGTVAGGIRQRITYQSFLYEYFSGCNDDQSGSNDNLREYGDGREFVIVTDSRAKPDEMLQLPPAQIPQFPVSISIDDAIKALLASGFHSDFASMQQKNPRLVKRLDRPDESYYLVPFVHGDAVDVVRLDAQGTYLGTAFGLAEPRVFADEGIPFGIERAVSQLGFLADDGGVGLPQDLVWSPSIESASPYSPFYRFSDRGEVKLAPIEGGPVLAELHDRLTRQPIACQPVAMT